MIDISVFHVTFLSTNCYLLTDRKTGDMAVVDPGGRSDSLIKTIRESRGKLVYVMLTHGHYDHIGFAKQLADMFDAKIVCGEHTNRLLQDNILNHSAFHDDIDDIKPFTGDILLSDNETFKLGETKIIYISTPGHTIDSGCFIFDDVLISGDTLFCESYGRTDLPTGNDADMIASIKRLSSLEGDFNVLPGHGITSTLSHERKYNPLMRMLK